MLKKYKKIVFFLIFTHKTFHNNSFLILKTKLDLLTNFTKEIIKFQYNYVNKYNLTNF